MRNHWLLIAVLVAGCGGEDEDAPPPRQNPNAPAGGAGAAPPPPVAAAPTPIVRPPGSKPKIEDRVTVEEEAAIRHVFRDRDFIVDENNRDPFQSFVLEQPGLRGTDNLVREVTKKCLRDDQFVATSYSYTDLVLVGIVAERTQKRVLMMPPNNKGVLIRKGDCVGREKAVVKDIGAGFITFQVEPDDNGSQTRQVEEHSVQLYPNQTPLGDQPQVTVEPSRTATPVVTPNSPSPQTPSPSGPASPSSPTPPVVLPK